MVMDKLAKYKSLRDKTKTEEPFGSSNVDSKKLYFVVQKHKATALHYDFRLEYCGVMASWAIPKGPTLDPAVRRLAMQTEDHPLDYRHFEGEIPQGEYGGGEVIIWDEGTYIPEKEVSKGERIQIKDKKEGEKVMLEGLEKGEMKFFLDGKRLRGSFALVKTKGFPPSKKNAWLLIKHRDEFAKEGFDAKNYVKSIVSDNELL
jgi:bifunctional non-homologous end joining protein LigD